MANEQPNKGLGCWAILLALSLICTMTGLWLSQRSALLTQQSIQRNIQIQQQQEEYQRNLQIRQQQQEHQRQLERSRR